MAQFSTAKGKTKAEQAKKSSYYADVQSERQARSRQVTHQQKMLAEGPGESPMTQLLTAAVRAWMKPEKRRSRDDRKVIARADALYANWRRRLPPERFARCPKA